MASRAKEEEKNERIIRGLLKLPANRRCINCNNLGPQYVCTNFWTFICINCSGIHREFTHRVKSISMAKFTLQEVSALQEGGNERAKEKYFKDWDQQRHSFPDSSNIDRLRDFIKHVYVDRRYTGERNMERPSRVKGDKEDSCENGRVDPYRGGSRSPPYGDTFERRYSDRPGFGGRYDDKNLRYGYGDRSPGYDQGYKRSPVRFEVIDDRHRDHRLGNENQNWKFEDRSFPDETGKVDGKSPNHQKYISESIPPMVRPVREILGDDVPQLRVGDLPKPNGTKAPDNSSRTQRVTSSSSMGSSDGNSVELKTANLGSLIDFNTDSEPPVAAVPQQPIPQQTTSQPANGGDWASFGIVAQQTPPNAASNTNLLESALGQLSAPLSLTLANSSVSPVAGVDSSKANVGRQWQTIQQQQPSPLSVADGQSASPPLNTTLVGTSNNQSWGPSLAPLPVIAGKPSQDITTARQESRAPISLPPPHLEAKHSGRTELPADLFTALYTSAPGSVPGWQRGPQYGMGYGMQYPTGAVIQAFPQSLKSANPFDFSNEPTMAHSSSFPSIASLQEALPNGANSSPLMRSSSFGAQTLQWVASQPPSFPSGPYMVQQGPSTIPQQTPNNMFPMTHQVAGGLGSQGASFGTAGVNQHSAIRYSQPGTPNSVVPVGGNPFG